MNLERVKKCLIIFISLFLLGIGGTSVTAAGTLSGNVKDCIEHPDKCQDSGTSKKEKSTATDDISGVSAWDYARMLFALLFVIVLIYFLIKFINKKSQTYQDSKLIQHLGGSPLGGNRSIQLVKVGERIFILGVGENIELLKEINDQEEYKQLLQVYNQQKDLLLDTKDIFTVALRKWQERKQKAVGKGGSAPFKSVLEKQLNEIKTSREQALQQLETKEKKSDE
ncbi:flagellar biosynthetic protein FliO [Bacillus smithii]|uniref:flagellar biosynthetic protein FliO n=1 Tax=Bacillus smithii TaxID=1479 RepID=UPI0022E1EB9E|nr:flagellar biosynthetic protein FliO [Bacillus smithii]MED0660587.1 flagellar biosynthetic protein FliO [Bacillus smithii]MED1419300.1 flagellar biosynthetic protein FliO [Bacillus smithii]MED1488097.1 flagellar biosynthetic protein FliO [Bacillus smithii]